ncbi:MAG: zinc-ribbon domain-containing protein, partial [Gemmiger sp.]
MWWVCPQGHRWQAAVSSRTVGGTGCPVCEGRQVIPGVNDFASRCPDLAAQWHPTQNLPLTPETVAAN